MTCGLQSSTGTPASIDADDPRCFALSAGARNLLSRLNVWPALGAVAQDVTEIAITDTPLDAAVRPVLLRYDNRLDDGTTAASIVPSGALLAALRAEVERRTNIVRVNGFEIVSLDWQMSSILLTSGDSRAVRAPLLIAADGRGSRVRALAGIKTNHFPHGQTGIVCVIRHARPHSGCATQHFLPAGPFAILPLVGNRSCITWSETDQDAERILALDDAGFLSEIDQRVGGQMGAVDLEGPRASFPLSTRMARTFIGPRLALVGDAAHGVHPIAGQGLNLAMRDVAALAERIAQAVRVGLDLGDQPTLEAYERWRRFDATLSAGVFDGLNRLFSSDVALLRSAREAGLGIVNRIAPLKRQLVREAAGLSGEVPLLMQPL